MRKTGSDSVKRFTSKVPENTLVEDLNNFKQQALDLGITLKIKYLNRNNAEFTEREVIPRTVTQGRNQVYLVGFCKLRNQERSFGLNNILHLEMGGAL